MGTDPVGSHGGTPAGERVAAGPRPPAFSAESVTCSTEEVSSWERLSATIDENVFQF
jgi:hypothetical protein